MGSEDYTPAEGQARREPSAESVPFGALEKGNGPPKGPVSSFAVLANQFHLLAAEPISQNDNFHSIFSKTSHVVNSLTSVTGSKVR